jgi:hypothetical protein
MKKFPVLLLIIFLISSCSNDDSVTYEFDKEIVKGKRCLMVYDLKFNKTYDCTNSLDTFYSIGYNSQIKDKKIYSGLVLGSNNEFNNFIEQYTNAINSKQDFEYSNDHFSIYKFEKEGDHFIYISHPDLVCEAPLIENEWKSFLNLLLKPNWNIKYISDTFYYDSIQERKQVTKEQFDRLMD